MRLPSTNKQPSSDLYPGSAASLAVADAEYAASLARRARRDAIKAASEAMLEGDPVAELRLRSQYQAWINFRNDLESTDDERDEDYGVIGNL